MSTTPRPPLLSDEDIKRIALGYFTPEYVQKSRVAQDLYNASYVAIHKALEICEAARAKDAERIEQLEALCRAMGNGLDEMMRPANRECDGAHCTGCWKDINGRLVKLLFAAGFKPTEP